MALSPTYTKIKELVLGKKYELSFAFVTPAQMRKAMKYKKEPAKKTSNVLAFPLSQTSGEILICKQAAKPFTPDYLFIHGLLHLKGMQHSDTMERTEHRLLKKFGFSVHE
jgi:ssRNA-specific RNase YbeY (16S rRNA maturation enzyme)